MDLVTDERVPEYAAVIRAYFAEGGPRSARLPGIGWPFTTYFLGGPADVAPDMSAVVANCRAYGGDWGIGATLMYRTHVLADSPGNLRGVDEELAELRTLSRRAGNARPEPERTRAEEVDAAARAVLPPERYAAERSRGASLTEQDALRELTSMSTATGS
ncbi:hypothetical protein ACFV2H_20885 [Streptomyces sp. NPDC059629]|uniref:hypothetical protein n=1 Tax=Streptomyces sp. NPDC059629 TaxID=3346889 RepID=UPI0036CE11F6